MSETFEVILVYCDSKYFSKLSQDTNKVKIVQNDFHQINLKMHKYHKIKTLHLWGIKNFRNVFISNSSVTEHFKRRIWLNYLFQNGVNQKKFYECNIRFVSPFPVCGFEFSDNAKGHIVWVMESGE